jgi:hypothetical protein
VRRNGDFAAVTPAWIEILSENSEKQAVFGIYDGGD